MGYPASSAAGQAVPFHPESGGNHSVKPSGSHSGTKLSARWGSGGSLVWVISVCSLLGWFQGSVEWNHAYCIFQWNIANIKCPANFWTNSTLVAVLQPPKTWKGGKVSAEQWPKPCVHTTWFNGKRYNLQITDESNWQVVDSDVFTLSYWLLILVGDCYTAVIHYQVVSPQL